MKKPQKLKRDSERFLSQKLEITNGAAAYRQLRQSVIQAGLLDRQYVYYLFLTLFVLFGFFVSLYYVITVKSILQLIFWSMTIGFFAVQFGGLLHDTGHRSVFKSTKWNDFFGHIFGALTAMGYSQWKVKHNAHHAHTNEEDGDPDIELPLLSFSEKRLNEKNKIVRFLVKYQAFLYYPLGSLVVFSTRITTLRYMVRNFKPKMWWEVCLYVISFLGWFVLPFIFFDFTKAFVFIVIANLTAGFYLLNVFAPNHKGMPYIEKGKKFSFLEQQVMTSRNIFGGALTDFVYMGLNYQIEHHLFPDCPRNKLRHIRPHIMKLSKKLGLEYTEVSIIESNRMILSELHTVSKFA
jgi:fatty acid desaturase